uniref:F-box domain-containing protein n=1 Tax=Brassica campestris TaxID=3711 RepID=M4CAW4_BRACM
MSSPEKRTSKKKKKEPSPNPSLPDDFLLSCFARISTLYYPSLSLVSKSFRSLLTSPELYKVRSLSDHTECCLYVCIQFFSDLGPTWYTLCRKPDQTKSSSSSSEYVLAKVPILNSPRASFTGLVSVGPNIYNINSGPVSILNCRSHTWSEGPSMRDDLYSLSASVVDEKIYVIGRWRELEGLVGLPELTSESSVRLADHGGKMAVLVSQNLSFYSRFSHKKVIWCGEISLERRNGGCEIWGKVEWFDHVLTVPAGCHVVKVLGVTV